MAKSNRAYKSAKRSKELERIRKREEKRRRRQGGINPSEAENPASGGQASEDIPAPEPGTSEPETSEPQ